MLVSTVEALASQQVPDLVLGYVFMRNAEEHLSEQHTPQARLTPPCHNTHAIAHDATPQTRPRQTESDNTGVVSSEHGRVACYATIAWALQKEYCR